MAHDLAAFEGDWWLLIEEQDHDRSPDQRWTLRDRHAFNLGVEMGTYSLDGDCLVIDQSAQGLTMRLNPHQEYPLDFLMGGIEGGVAPTWCTFLRVGSMVDDVIYRVAESSTE
ncbi:hypothetical protein [Sphingomonas sp. PB4P5]|uniref:hypothetical protein n=1 Tax=Parasphingomonas puruogangriensis TaxID=3096155 RepID=UPI002FCA1A43